MNDHATDCYDAMLCQLMCQPNKGTIYLVVYFPLSLLVLTLF